MSWCSLQLHVCFRQRKKSEGFHFFHEKKRRNYLGDVRHWCQYELTSSEFRLCYETCCETATTRNYAGRCPNEWMNESAMWPLEGVIVDRFFDLNEMEMWPTYSPVTRSPLTVFLKFVAREISFMFLRLDSIDAKFMSRIISQINHKKSPRHLCSNFMKEFPSRHVLYTHNRKL